jgi:protein-arginine kinase activator protein McsA
LERILESLRRELSESVRREEFERAASIRDEIRRYEKEKAELASPKADEEDTGE